jgi:hypothetical protein
LTGSEAFSSGLSSFSSVVVISGIVSGYLTSIDLTLSLLVEILFTFGLIISGSSFKVGLFTSLILSASCYY